MARSAPGHGTRDRESAAMMKKIWWWSWRIFLGLFVFMLLYQAWIAVHVWWWIDHNPASSSFMDDRLEVMQDKNPDAVLKHQWVPYKKISGNLKRALIASEDAKFVDHEGFDWEGIQKAYEKNLKKGKIVAGGSTISQQLAKNLFLDGERSLLRKGQEILITFMLEGLLGKQRILEIYLNSVEWGEGIFGAQAAARHYFHVDAGKLSTQQAAQLAVMLPAPKRFEKRPASAYVLGRAATVSARMAAVELP